MRSEVGFGKISYVLSGNTISSFAKIRSPFPNQTPHFIPISSNPKNTEAEEDSILLVSRSAAAITALPVLSLALKITMSSLLE